MISYEVEPIYYGNDITDDYRKLETYLNDNCSSTKKVNTIISTNKTTTVEARWLIIWEITE